MIAATVARDLAGGRQLDGGASIWGSGVGSGGEGGDGAGSGTAGIGAGACGPVSGVSAVG